MKLAKHVMRVGRGSPGENKCSLNSGKKKNCKLNFFSMYFVRKNEKYIRLLKIADTSFKLRDHAYEY